MERLQELMAQVAQSPAATVAVALACALALGSAIRFLARVLGGLYAHFLRRGLNLRKYGQWAVVTGATDGIGRAYADALAKQSACLALGDWGPRQAGCHGVDWAADRPWMGRIMQPCHV